MHEGSERPWTIDAHHHFWSVGDTELDWDAPATRTINRDFAPQDLEVDLESAGVDATVLVQVANAVEDTERLLELAAATPFVAGVVGWVPLEDPTSTSQVLDDLVGEERLVGVRHLINVEPDPDWVVRPGVIDGLRVLADRDLVFEGVPVTTHQLGHFLTVAERLPELRIVIDHLGNPPLLADGWEPWAGLVTELAQYPNVAVKVSVGLDVVVAWERWNLDDLRPYLEHTIDVFGAERSIAASNWPVVLLAGSYVDVWRQLRSGLAVLSEQERAQVLGGSAARWYRLPSTVGDAP